MYKIISCLVFIFNLNLCYAALTTQDVQVCIDTIRQLPEARQMMAEIHKEGSLRIAVSNHSLSRQFGAYWDMEQRVICVHPGFHNSLGELIGSILFEMHNAFSHSKILHYDELAMAGQIDRESYVRSIEYIEYLNSKETAAMAQIGIERGIFPPETKRFTYKDFDEHYYYQKYGGHSDWIARTYDRLVSL
jgi:hypothetical protein